VSDTTLPAPLVEITDPARATILEARAAEQGADDLGLWIEVSGAAGDTYTYEIWFQSLSEAGPNEVVQRHDDLSVVIPAKSIDRLRGAKLDVTDVGLAIDNPNRPEPAPASPAMQRAPSGDLTGDVAQRLIQVLNDQINPSIAMHGGSAELVAVEDDVAYVRLSGGCQGCGLAAVTLSRGIEVAIKDSVPEISRVVDVTDHSSGSNPYYEPAKK
jgi:Fe/S biogenesis protein NfuA